MGRTRADISISFDSVLVFFVFIQHEEAVDDRFCRERQNIGICGDQIDKTIAVMILFIYNYRYSDIKRR